MKASSYSIAVSRIRKLVQRDTGQYLSDPCALEIETLLSSMKNRSASPDEDHEFQSREVSILLADLRGFTAISSDRPAGEVLQMLNPVLVKMSEIIFKHGGTIDKFMGDSIMVLFGAPGTRSDDVARALSCAVEMQMWMREYGIEQREKGLPELFMGIGINTGDVLAGTLGSDVYSEYTVIGDAVNLTSRIEAFSLRGQVLISQSTYERSSDFVMVADPMSVSVKGKSQPVKLYEVLSIPTRGLRVPRQEVRRSHRVSVKLPFSYQLVRDNVIIPSVYNGVIRDIGYHGVLIETEHSLPPMTDMKMEIALPQVDYLARDLYGKSVNTKVINGSCCTGVEFTSVSADTNSKIQLLVQLHIFAAA
jgi:adenylate cyclase